MAPEHLVGTAEVARMLAVTAERVRQLAASYDDFPRPVAELESGRVWATADIEAWIARHPERRPGRPRKSGSP